MKLFEAYRETYAKARDEEMSLLEYLELCREDPLAFASASERMLAAIGEPEFVDTRDDSRLSRIYSNRVIRRYPAFREFYGMEEAISQIVSYFTHAAQGLEERKQVLYLLGPVGGGKSSIAERLKVLMEEYPIYALKGSPINESPLGLFNPDRDAEELEKEYNIPRRYLTGIMSPWAIKRLTEFDGDLTQFRVVRVQPSVLRQISIAKTEPGDENNQDISSLRGLNPFRTWQICKPVLWDISISTISSIIAPFIKKGATTILLALALSVSGNTGDTESLKPDRAIAFSQVT